MSGSHQTPPVDAEVGLLDVEEAKGPLVELAGEGQDDGPYPRGTFVKVGSGMLVLVAMVVATYVVPALAWARPWKPGDPVLFWNVIGRELLDEQRELEEHATEIKQAQQIARVIEQEEDQAPIVDAVVIDPPKDNGLPPYKPHPDDEQEVRAHLEHDDPTVLDPFFARLARTEAGFAHAVTRVVQWGDSAIANDHVTSALRQKMQRRFGDAGHGFHLLAKPNASYRHKGIRFSGGESWSRCYIINKCKKDGHYGLGGTTVWSSGGAKSRFRTATKTPYGQKTSRFELWYAAMPRGGKVRIRVDGGEPVFVETAAEQLEDRWHTIEVPDGAHRFEVRASGGGQVRLYGAVLERDVPGVVWDGMAQLGAFTSRMLYFDEAHLARQIAHRDPGLLVFMFGGNDLLLRKSQLPRFRENFAEVLRRFRGQSEPPACLVVSPVDHGVRKGQRIVSNPMVRLVSDIQRDVAMEQGCAFFDTQAAMGGDGSVGRWRRSKPPLISADLAHLTESGQKVIGHLVYLALMEKYRDYRSRAR